MGFLDRIGRNVLFASVLVVMLILCVAVGTVAAQSAPDCSEVEYAGDGTSDDPYEISNLSKLQCIEEHDLGATYHLVSDIDALQTAEWNGEAGFDPIGIPQNETGFSGIFDGRGHNITRLSINRSGRLVNFGLFGTVVEGGTVKNVSVVDAVVRGDSGVGALVGFNEGTVERSSASGVVYGSGNAVGGLVGSNFGRISKSFADVTVDGTLGTSGVGGLSGANTDGLIEDSYAVSDVDGSSHVGGLVGANYGRIARSYTASDVDADGSGRAGGLVGVNDGTVDASYWDMDATELSSSPAGIGLTTQEMTGNSSVENMSGLDFQKTWETADGYPKLSWEVETDESDTSPGFGSTTVLLVLVAVILLILVSVIALNRKE
jgi:hypothetical protein